MITDRRVITVHAYQHPFSPLPFVIAAAGLAALVGVVARR